MRRALIVKPLPLPRVLLILLALAVPFAHAERIKDLAQIQGVRTNQLVGYGLVVGLDSTGDQTSQAPFTVQSLNNMLAQLGITVPANVTPQLKNVAAVAVHAGTLLVLALLPRLFPLSRLRFGLDVLRSA